MAMGKRRGRERQPSMWVASSDLPRSAGPPFYERLNRVLGAAGFDAFVEEQCAKFYAEGVGRPSLAPGRYCRMLLLGFFEGLDSERAIAWRAADSLSLRQFLDMSLDAAPPDHSTVLRTRRRVDVETHLAVFTWVLQRLAEAGLVRGKTVGIDATTLEANAALRSIVRRDTGAGYDTFLRQLAPERVIDFTGMRTRPTSGVSPSPKRKLRTANHPAAIVSALITNCMTVNAATAPANRRGPAPFTGISATPTPETSLPTHPGLPPPRTSPAVVPRCDPLLARLPQTFRLRRQLLRDYPLDSSKALQGTRGVGLDLLDILNQVNDDGLQVPVKLLYPFDDLLLRILVYPLVDDVPQRRVSVRHRPVHFEEL